MPLNIHLNEQKNPSFVPNRFGIAVVVIVVVFNNTSIKTNFNRCHNKFATKRALPNSSVTISMICRFLKNISKNFKSWWILYDSILCNSHPKEEEQMNKRAIKYISITYLNFVFYITNHWSCLSLLRVNNSYNQNNFTRNYLLQKLKQICHSLYGFKFT